MRIGVLTHNPSIQSINIGDDIQTLGALNALSVLGYTDVSIIDRENPLLSTDFDSTEVILMQGWLMHSPENFLQFARKPCIFFSIHFSDALRKVISHNKKYQEFLQANAPIGCRDRGTCDFVQSFGIEAYFSGCLSVIQDRSESYMQNSSVFLVDGDFLFPFLGNFINGGDVELFSHTIGGKNYSDRIQKAKNLLQKYAQQASLVITTKLHCVLPCLAMGIPVIFLRTERQDTRLDLVAEYTKNIYYIPRLEWLPWIQLRNWIIKKFFIKKYLWKEEVIDIQDNITETLLLLKKALVGFQK